MLTLTQMRPAGAAGVSDHALLSNLDYAAAGHTGFCSLATVQTITAEKLIDSAVGLRFGHAAGPLLQGGASPRVRLTLTGDLLVASGHAAIGAVVAVAADKALNVIETLATHPANAVYTHITGNRAAGSQFTYGISGAASGQGTPSAAYVYGLYFFAQHASASPCFQLGGILIQQQSAVAGSGALTIARGLYLPAAYWGGALPAIVVGVDIEEQGGAGTGTAYGFRCANQTATTVRLLELGPDTPYLRLVGGAAPAAGLTHLWLYEGTTPALRNVGFAVADAGGHVPAGAKVLYLV